MIGRLSEKYESNGKAGAIGYDSVGGWSYGSYQIASNPGTLGLFLAWLSKKNPSAFGRLQRAGGEKAGRGGSDAFKAAWKQLADGDPDFARNQHAFIKFSHYDPQASRVKAAGVDPETRSAALRDVIWSTAVQHGKSTNVITGVIAEHGALPDAQLIPLIYVERRTRFGRSTPAVRASVMRRFDSECADALEMLRYSRDRQEPDLQVEVVPPHQKSAQPERAAAPDQKPNDRSKYL